MMPTITKSKSKSKSRKSKNEIIDNNSDDNDNDTEIDKKLLSKKVIKLQNETMLQLQTEFIQSNGLISLGYQ